MILIDTGVLVDLFNEQDKNSQEQATTLFQSLAPPFITTWPCLTETLHLINQPSKADAQERLKEYFTKGIITLHQPEADEWKRAFELMRKYDDRPMDFADASLIVLAEQRGLRKILTLDSDFYFYSINGKDSFEVVRPRKR
jgi:uncharacterized protein